MPKFKSGYLTGPVLLILALITAGVAGIILFNAKLINQAKSPQVTPTPTPSAPQQEDTTVYTDEESANWKIYINTDYSYQLKYPSTLITEIPKFAPQVFVIHFSEKGEYVQVQTEGISSLGISKEMEFDMQRINPSKSIFLDKPSVSIRPARNIYPGEPFKATISYLEDKKLKIVIGYYGDGKNEKLFDQILSTFKFVQ